MAALVLSNRQHLALLTQHLLVDRAVVDISFAAVALEQEVRYLLWFKVGTFVQGSRHGVGGLDQGLWCTLKIFHFRLIFDYAPSCGKMSHYSKIL